MRDLVEMFDRGLVDPTEDDLVSQFDRLSGAPTPPITPPASYPGINVPEPEMPSGLASAMARELEPERRAAEAAGMPTQPLTERVQERIGPYELPAEIPEYKGPRYKFIVTPQAEAAINFWRDDYLKRVKPHQRNWVQDAAEEFLRGNANVAADHAWWDAAWGYISEDQAAQRSGALEALRQADPVENANALQWLLNNIAQTSAPMLAGQTQGMASAVTLAGAAAAIPGGAAIAPAAGALGLVGGSMQYWYRQGAGEVYRELRQRGVDSDTARAIGSAAGGLYAAIEFSQAGRIFRSLPMKGTVRENLLQRIVRKAIETGEAFAKRYPRTARGVGYGVRFGTHQIHEANEEFMQKASQDSFIYLGTEADRDAGLPNPEIGDWVVSTGGAAAKEWAYALATLGAMMVPAGVHGVMRTEREYAESDKQMVRTKAMLARSLRQQGATMVQLRAALEPKDPAAIMDNVSELSAQLDFWRQQGTLRQTAEGQLAEAMETGGVARDLPEWLQAEEDANRARMSQVLDDDENKVRVDAINQAGSTEPVVGQEPRIAPAPEVTPPETPAGTMTPTPPVEGLPARPMERGLPVSQEREIVPEAPGVAIPPPAATETPPGGEIAQPPQPSTAMEGEFAPTPAMETPPRATGAPEVAPQPTPEVTPEVTPEAPSAARPGGETVTPPPGPTPARAVPAAEAPALADMTFAQWEAATPEAAEIRKANRNPTARAVRLKEAYLRRTELGKVSTFVPAPQVPDTGTPAEAASRKAGFPLVPGKTVYLVVKRPYGVERMRVRIAEVVSPGNIRVGPHPKAAGKFKDLFGTPDHIADVTQLQPLLGFESYRALFAGMTGAEKRETEKRAKEFDDRLMGNPDKGIMPQPPFVTPEDFQGVSDSKESMHAILVEARKRAAEVLGEWDVDMDNPIVRADLLRRLKEWIVSEGDWYRRAEEWGGPTIGFLTERKREQKEVLGPYDLPDVAADTLHDGDILEFDDVTFAQVHVTPEGITLEREGRTEPMAPDAKLADVYAVHTPLPTAEQLTEDPSIETAGAYERALANWHVQELQWQQAQARMAHEAEMESERQAEREWQRRQDEAARAAAAEVGAAREEAWRKEHETPSRTIKDDESMIFDHILQRRQEGLTDKDKHTVTDVLYRTEDGTAFRTIAFRTDYGAHPRMPDVGTLAYLRAVTEQRSKYLPAGQDPADATHAEQQDKADDVALDEKLLTANRDQILRRLETISTLVGARMTREEPAAEAEPRPDILKRPYVVTAGKRTYTGPDNREQTIPVDVSIPLGQRKVVAMSKEANAKDETAGKRMIPPFQGNKRVWSGHIRAALQAFFTPAELSNIDAIEDYFGGTGSWGLFLALEQCQNVKTLRLHEFNEDRIAKIKWLHANGRRAATVVRENHLIEILKMAHEAGQQDSIRLWGGRSASAMMNEERVNEMVKMYEQATGNVLTDDGRTLLCFLIERGARSNLPLAAGEAATAITRMVGRAVGEAQQIQNAVEFFQKRGGKIEYIPGDSYLSTPTRGANVLAVLDPAYAFTTGYNGTQVVGLDVYNQTADLVAGTIAAGNNVLYTDSEWWTSPKHNMPDQATDAFRTLKRIFDMMDGMDVTPFLIGQRREVIGLYNAQNKAAQGIPTETARPTVRFEALPPARQRDVYGEAMRRHQEGDALVYVAIDNVNPQSLAYLEHGRRVRAESPGLWEGYLRQAREQAGITDPAQRPTPEQQATFDTVFDRLLRVDFLAKYLSGDDNALSGFSDPATARFHKAEFFETPYSEREPERRPTPPALSVTLARHSLFQQARQRHPERIGPGRYGADAEEQPWFQTLASQFGEHGYALVPVAGVRWTGFRDDAQKALFINASVRADNAETWAAEQDVALRILNGDYIAQQLRDLVRDEATQAYRKVVNPDLTPTEARNEIVARYVSGTLDRVRMGRLYFRDMGRAEWLQSHIRAFRTMAAPATMTTAVAQQQDAQRRLDNTRRRANDDGNTEEIRWWAEASVDTRGIGDAGDRETDRLARRIEQLGYRVVAIRNTPLTGATDEEDKTVFVRLEGRTPEQVRDSLAHELFHALRWIGDASADQLRRMVAIESETFRQYAASYLANANNATVAKRYAENSGARTQDEILARVVEWVANEYTGDWMKGDESLSAGFSDVAAARQLRTDILSTEPQAGETAFPAEGERDEEAAPSRRGTRYRRLPERWRDEQRSREARERESGRWVGRAHDAWQDFQSDVRKTNQAEVFLSNLDDQPVADASIRRHETVRGVLRKIEAMGLQGVPLTHLPHDLAGFFWRRYVVFDATNPDVVRNVDHELGHAWIEHVRKNPHADQSILSLVSNVNLDAPAVKDFRAWYDSRQTMYGKRTDREIAEEWVCETLALNLTEAQAARWIEQTFTGGASTMDLYQQTRQHMDQALLHDALRADLKNRRDPLSGAESVIRPDTVITEAEAVYVAEKTERQADEWAKEHETMRIYEATLEDRAAFNRMIGAKPNLTLADFGVALMGLHTLTAEKIISATPPPGFTARQDTSDPTVWYIESNGFREYETVARNADEAFQKYADFVTQNGADIRRWGWTVTSEPVNPALQIERIGNGSESTVFKINGCAYKFVRTPITSDIHAGLDGQYRADAPIAAFLQRIAVATGIGGIPTEVVGLVEGYIVIKQPLALEAAAMYNFDSLRDRAAQTGRIVVLPGWNSEGVAAYRGQLYLVQDVTPHNIMRSILTIDADGARRLAMSDPIITPLTPADLGQALPEQLPYIQQAQLLGDDVDRARAAFMPGKRARRQIPAQVHQLEWSYDQLLADAHEFIRDDQGRTVGVTDQARREIAYEMDRIEMGARSDGTWMKAPNGKHTNLTETLWKVVRTARFKRWFGDWENAPERASKVVDDNGEPMVVYHGTGADFAIFDDRIGRIPEWPRGARPEGMRGNYFTPDPSVATQYAGEKGTVISAFLNIQNPARMTIATSVALTDAAIDGLRQQGFDGGISRFGEKIIESVITFAPSQIKSAIGNITFDPRTPDIRYEALPPPAPGLGQADLLRELDQMQAQLRAGLRNLERKGMRVSPDLAESIKTQLVRIHKLRHVARNQAALPHAVTAMAQQAYDLGRAKERWKADQELAIARKAGEWQGLHWAIRKHFRHLQRLLGTKDELLLLHRIWNNVNHIQRTLADSQLTGRDRATYIKRTLEQVWDGLVPMMVKAAHGRAEPLVDALFEFAEDTMKPRFGTFVERMYMKFGPAYDPNISPVRNRFIVKLTDAAQQTMDTAIHMAQSFVMENDVGTPTFDYDRVPLADLIQVYQLMSRSLAQHSVTKQAIKEARLRNLEAGKGVLAEETINAGYIIAPEPGKPFGGDLRYRNWLTEKVKFRQLVPENLVIALGGGKTSLFYRMYFDAIERGQERGYRLWMDAEERINEALRKHGFTGMRRTDLSNEQRRVKMPSGNVYEVTPAQLMYLYALRQRDLGRYTLEKNGAKLYTHKHTTVALDTRLNDLQRNTAVIDALVGALTADEKAVADEIVAVMSSMAPYINEVSMKTEGRKIANDPKYMQMFVDVQDMMSTPELIDINKSPHDVRLSQLPWLKDPVEHSNPVLIADIFDVTSKHLREVGHYVGLAVPVDVCHSLLTFKEKKGADTLADIIGSAHGTARVEDLLMYLRAAEGLERIHGSFEIRWLQRLSANVARSVLGFAPVPRVMNAIGRWAFLVDIDEQSPEAARWYRTHMFAPVNRFSAAYERDLAFLMEDGILAHRWEQDIMRTYVPYQSERLDSRERTRLRSALRQVQEWGMRGMKREEQKNAILAYRAYLHAGFAPETAREMVRKGIRRSQNASTPLEEAPFMRGARLTGWGGVYPFMSQTVAQLNQIFRQISLRRKRGIILSIIVLALTEIVHQALQYAQYLMVGKPLSPEDRKKKDARMLAVRAVMRPLTLLMPGFRPLWDSLEAAAIGTMGGGGGTFLMERPMELFATETTRAIEAALSATGLIDKDVNMTPRDWQKFSAALAQLYGVPYGGPAFIEKATIRTTETPPKKKRKKRVKEAYLPYE